MVSNSATFGLSKRRLSRKADFIPFPLAGMKHLIKNPFVLAEKLLPLLGIEKIEENWFKPNFKHCVHQQKKPPNKSTKLLSNWKSISFIQNEGCLEKCDFTEPKSYFHSSQYLKKKIKKTVSSTVAEIIIFF